MTQPVEIDALERRIVHALQIDGRVAFTDLGAVLGVSARTVSRRYARLRSSGALRVVGVTDAAATGRSDWLLRWRGDARGCARTAASLARRDDARWVGLAAGGTEVTAVVRDGGPATAVAHGLPVDPGAAVVGAQCLLRTVAGHAGWPGRTRALSTAETAALTPPHRPRIDPDLGDADGPLVAALARDGRAAVPALARATGWSESTVRRRLEDLRRGGALHFEVDVDPALFGIRCEAVLWLTVPPAHVTGVAARLAEHPAVAFAAVTSGATTLVVFVLCPDLDALPTLVVDDLGSIPGVERVDTAPIAAHVKRSGTVLLPT